MNPLNGLSTVVRRRLIVLLVVSALALGSQVAYAHFVYAKVFTYYTTTLPCVQNRAETSHGSGYGYTKANVWSWKLLQLPDPFGTAYCTIKFDRPQLHIKVKAQVHYKPSGGSWQMCYNPAYKFNQTVTWKETMAKTFNSSSWCGPGTYGTWNLGYVKNNTWYGGYVWSGTHTL